MDRNRSRKAEHKVPPGKAQCLVVSGWQRGRDRNEAARWAGARLRSGTRPERARRVFTTGMT